MDNIRLLLFVALAFLGLLLWEAWQADYGQPVATDTATAAAAGRDAAPVLPSPDSTPSPSAADVPAGAVAATDATASVPLSTTTTDTDAADTYVSIETDVLSVDVSSRGGNLVRAALLHYPVAPEAPTLPVVLMGEDPGRVFIAQGGLAGSDGLPNHHAVFSAAAARYTLAAGSDELVVPLTWRGNGIEVEKRYRLRRGSYLITVEYTVTNTGTEALTVHQYEQLKRNEESSRDGLVYTYTGAVLSTPENRFEKYDVDDLEEQALDIEASDAWVGIMQHYFATALIPSAAAPAKFYSKLLPERRYLVGFVSPPAKLAAGETVTLSASLFIGPKAHEVIENIAPGLELTVDYGVLWFIADPLYRVLAFLKGLLGNWGWAIIAVTILLKLMFYPLSAAGYRSMANMRRVQPRMLALRDRYADDRAQLNQQMMKLYKEERINPLGGCLPILIQIPVFIALYWVLLESVEMRQAPFILWISDLSTRDPWFVLPLLMGISMYLQQKLNPAPLDPTQAKVMQILPFVFTVFFAFFPAGLVLYWLVNNILSIAQQWHITRAIEQGDG